MIFIFVVIIFILSYIIYRLVKDRALFLMILGVSAIITGFLSFLVGVILDNAIRGNISYINVRGITDFVLDRFLLYTLGVGVAGIFILIIGAILKLINSK